MKLLFVLLSFLLVVELLIVTGQGVTYCVKPNSTATCSTEDHCDQCQTLQYFFDNINTTINQEKSVTMTFMNGTHTVALTAEHTMILAPTVNMTGRNSGVSVVCNHCNNCLLLFINNINISIRNLNVMHLQQREINPALGGLYFIFLNTTAMIEDFHAYRSGILINSSSLTIRGECEFAGSTGFVAVDSGLSNITLSGNVTFVNNTGAYGAAVFLFVSKLTIATDANIMFINNSVTNSGGAMYLYLSYLHIESGVNMIFINNSAHDRGGAIYIGPDLIGDSYVILMIFMSAVSKFYSPNCDNASVHLSFDNNSAAAGDDIYGASLEAWFYIKISSCYAFTFSSNVSSISSHPLRACLCDSVPQCTNTNISRQVHPGERFTVPLAIVGYDFQPNVGIIYANLLHNNNPINTKLDPASQNGHVINNGKQCTDLSFSLFSNETSQTIVMYITPENTAQIALSYMKTFCHLTDDKACIHITPVYLEITILPCPPGFLLRDGHCDCYLVEIENCSIVNGIGYFSWNTTAWMSIENNALLYSSPCPVDYCNITGKNIDLQHDSDSQCAFNRAGRLCGHCKDNYSLAIGSSHCIYCPNNNNLALLIFFAAAGFLVVFFISAFNLTVTQGVINGLIFYANIVWIYQSIFFPQQLSNPALMFLRIFIAWVNLDFGIETCFVNGLDAFWKTWLQFIFPFYIMAIAGLIIVAAKYSIRVTNLLGNRSVPVLNTLFLFSYMKLLRTAISIVRPSILHEYPINSMLYVWSDDGNLLYWGTHHIFLFLAGLAILLVGLFLTVGLLLMQWLRKGSHLLCLKWITQFNPVYDSFFAPLKHKHQYWFGVLLLARVILYVIFAFSYFIPQGINLLLLQISMIVLLCYMTLAQPYKNWTMLIFQSTYLANLAVLSGYFLFTKTQSYHAKSTLFAIIFSTVFAFVPFCCIVFYETVVLIKKNCKLIRCRDIYHNINNEASPMHFSISYCRDPVIHSREEQPLLDLSDSSNQPTY